MSCLANCVCYELSGFERLLVSSLTGAIDVVDGRTWDVLESALTWSDIPQDLRKILTDRRYIFESQADQRVFLSEMIDKFQQKRMTSLYFLPSAASFSCVTATPISTATEKRGKKTSGLYEFTEYALNVASERGVCVKVSRDALDEPGEAISECFTQLRESGIECGLTAWLDEPMAWLADIPQVDVLRLGSWAESLLWYLPIIKTTLIRLMQDGTKVTLVLIDRGDVADTIMWQSILEMVEKAGLVFFPEFEILITSSNDPQETSEAALTKDRRLAAWLSQKARGTDYIKVIATGPISRMDALLRPANDYRVTAPPFSFCQADGQSTLWLCDDGLVYPCPSLIGEYPIGRFSPQLNLSGAPEHWVGWNVLAEPACSVCEVVGFCGGGCRAGALKEFGTPNRANCLPPYKDAHGFLAQIKDDLQMMK